LWQSWGPHSYAPTWGSPRKCGTTTPPISPRGSRFKNDKREIFSAAAHAQKAVDFLHGLQQPKAEAA
jgi:antirestriction protein ArdC